ncbi:mannose-6-phosphate isomerase [Malassezia yamatoensis]|uniref:Mannose-6-phosphate isomerase n=1 Tax=Malassezia yamatoensis TaxID=253288 RepID=A0AAJ6CIB3_9BASI|nr:mannose-6-phosphate isomerase [Malassezia yamatoensis]
MTVFRLIPGVQSYEWGIKGGEKNSICADLAEATPELEFKRSATTPYAELWMGTHPTLPSRLADDKSKPLLNEVLCQNPGLLGDEVVKKYGTSKAGSLPFLFKVLSISQALSIQAHPNKRLAERLHAEKPDMYKDDNHKPEMAIAIAAFSGFCGFRPVREILHFIEAVPELHSMLHADDALRKQLQTAADAQENQWKGNSDENASKTVYEALKLAFSKLANTDKTVYQPAVKKLVARYQEARENHQPLEVSEDIADLVIRLNHQHPQDIGIFCTFFLNVVHLQPGEALFLCADEPHAYLSGHILECMAASDNVVRAGLTPKARDVDVLVDMLTYRSTRADDQLLKAVQWDGDNASPNPTLLYDPPIEEFSVLVTTLTDKAGKSSQRALRGPSVVLVVEGKGTLQADGQSRELYAGLVLFVGANTPIQVSSDQKLVVSRAFLEINA